MSSKAFIVYGRRDQDDVEIHVHKETGIVSYRWWEGDVGKMADMIQDVPRDLKLAFEVLKTKHSLRTKLDWTIDAAPYIWEVALKEGEKDPEDQEQGENDDAT